MSDLSKLDNIKFSAGERWSARFEIVRADNFKLFYSLFYSLHSSQLQGESPTLFSPGSLFSKTSVPRKFYSYFLHDELLADGLSFLAPKSGLVEFYLPIVSIAPLGLPS